MKTNNKKTPEQLQLIFSGVKQREPDDKHVFRNAALGEVWTFLTGMAGVVMRLTKKDRTLREVSE